MDRFLDYIERYKFAIIGTVFFHVLFFITTNFTTIRTPYGHNSEQYEEIELDADAIEMDEEMMEMLERLNEQNELKSEQLYNLTADANDQRERSYENFSAQDLDAQVEREARELEQQFFDEWAATHPDSEDLPPRDNGDNDLSADNNKPNIDPNKSVTGDAGANAFAGQVMVEYSLKGRKHHSLEIPGYTCNGSGTVVIDIKVDKSGNVKSAEFNSSFSRGATECMILKSKRYAKKARFDYSQSASGLSSGTITYKFQGQ
ncbi:MAG: hypothetical protein GQ574_00770 [Crocinitomix sp.]|nr:hypothetical protein [Crocinitomix sp.]